MSYHCHTAIMELGFFFHRILQWEQNVVTFNIRLLLFGKKQGEKVTF